MRLMQSDGAENFLQSTGIAESKWLKTTQEYAESYGAFGLFFLQVAPVPIPTAVMVMTGVLAQIDEMTIYAVVIGSKFLQLCLGACVMKSMAGEDLETALRE